METLGNFLKFSSPLDWLVITLTILLFLVGIVLLIASRNSKPFYFFLVLALLPLVVGLCTTYLKSREVERMLAMVPAGSAVEVAAAGQQEAWIATYIGALGTAVLVVIGLVGSILKKRK